MTEANQDQSQNQTQAPTIDEIHNEHLSAFEAFQAAPDKPELKEAAAKAAAKYKDAFAADKKAREEAAAKGRPPEKYDFKPPQGTELDPKLVEDVSTFAKAKGLSNDVAQAILERDNARFAAYVEQVEGRQKAALEAEQKAWDDQLRSDKEFGGENLPKFAELTKRFVAKYGPELQKELDETGLGKHPGFFRMIARVIRDNNFSEDSLVVGGSTGSDPKDPASVMYDKTNV